MSSLALPRTPQGIWIKEALDILNVVVPVCTIAFSIAGDVSAALPTPRYFQDAYTRLTSPFRNFLTLRDLGEAPGGTVSVPVLKARILVVSACLISLSCLASLTLQLILGIRESVLRTGILFIAWVS